MKLAIIGAAGSIGAPTAFYTALQNVVDEIKMVDPNKDLLKNHVMDMDQAVIEASNTKVVAADYSDLGDCDIFMIVAAKPAKVAASRDEWLADNLGLLKFIQADIKKYAHNKPIICATNPSDVCTYYLYRELGWDRNKIIGFCVNDGVRVKWALSHLMNLDYKKLDAMCIGEHGIMQVPLWDHVTYDGKPLTIPADIRKAAPEMIENWLQEFLPVASTRTTGWLSAISLASLVRDIAQGSKRPIAVTTPLDGEYGQKGICLGVPAILGPNGVEKIVELDLAQEQKDQMNAAAAKVRGLIEASGIK
ncbi:hypothetical protein LJC48_04105 [Desulfovibrio sp. OttesenSCG-928-C06]|nr:hypothetical protein [Desulfovibrio sp. OttesenSCG-928-C06]